jgi:hypothetical protein
MTLRLATLLGLASIAACRPAGPDATGPESPSDAVSASSNGVLSASAAPTDAPSAAATAAPRTQTAARAPAPVRPDEYGPPEPIAIPVVEKICKAAPCSGPGARIWVFMKDNQIRRYLHHGDRSSCTHPPSVYFDREGREVGAMPMRPVKDADDQRRLDQERARLEALATPVAEIDCTGRTLGPVKR